MLFYQEIKTRFKVLLNIKSEIIPYTSEDKTLYILKFIISESKLKPVSVNYDGMPFIFIRRDGLPYQL